MAGLVSQIAISPQRIIYYNNNDIFAYRTQLAKMPNYASVKLPSGKVAGCGGRSVR